MVSVREIVFYKNYFEDFFDLLAENVKEKIDEILYMISILDRIPAKFFKSVGGIKGLYEIRIEYRSNIYRIFCCLTKQNWWFCLMDFRKRRRKHH